MRGRRGYFFFDRDDLFILDQDVALEAAAVGNDRPGADQYPGHVRRVFSAGRSLVEFADHLVPALHLAEDARPDLPVLPEAVQVGDLLALLLDPGEVFQVVDGLAVGDRSAP